MYKLVVRRVGRMAKSLQLSLHELSSEEIRPLMPRLKDLVTSSTVHVNPKNQPAYDVRNQANIFATSNQMNPIHVEPQERRIVVFACNGSKKGDTAYFGRLLAHLNGAKRDAVARAFYQYLRDNVEVAPFLPFQEHRPRTAAYICCLRREREIGEIGVCRSATSRNIPLFYKFLSAAIRQAAECHTERDTIKASTFHSQFHPVPSLGARRQLQHEHDDAEQVRGRPRGADARIGGERSAAGHAHQEAAWRGPTLHGALGRAANVLAGDSAVRLERRVRPSAVLDVHVEVKG